MPARSAIGRLTCYSNTTCELGGLMRLFKRAVAVLALAGFLFFSSAAHEKLSTPPVPRAGLFGSTERAGPQISPARTQLRHPSPNGCVLLAACSTARIS